MRYYCIENNVHKMHINISCHSISPQNTVNSRFVITTFFLFCQINLNNLFGSDNL